MDKTEAKATYRYYRSRLKAAKKGGRSAVLTTARRLRPFSHGPEDTFITAALRSVLGG